MQNMPGMCVGPSTCGPPYTLACQASILSRVLATLVQYARPKVIATFASATPCPCGLLPQPCMGRLSCVLFGLGRKSNLKPGGPSLLSNGTILDPVSVVMRVRAWLGKPVDQTRLGGREESVAVSPASSDQSAIWW